MFHPNPEQPMQHCPRCGAGGLEFNNKNRFSCTNCAFVFYQNTAAATGAILTITGGPRAGCILLLRRARNPAAGKLDFPGGFVDPGETAEEALRREIREEINLEANNLAYFFSAPNRYEYRGVVYNTLDLVFTGSIDTVPVNLEEAEISGYAAMPAEEVDPETIAFPSLRAALAHLVRANTR